MLKGEIFLIRDIHAHSFEVTGLECTVLFFWSAAAWWNYLTIKIQEKEQK